LKTEAVDLFCVALPVITRKADGTQDSLAVRIRTGNGLFGWGEGGTSRSRLEAAIRPPSHLLAPTKHHYSRPLETSLPAKWTVISG